MSTPLARGSVSVRLYPHDLDAISQIDVLRQQAALASDIGYDGVMVSEHHADFPGYLPNPVQLAGLLLDAMPQGWAAPCPLLLPMKPYAFFAEDLAWLEAAYPGRVGAGFAAGALPVDFELAEVPFDEIIPRFKTALPLIVEALRGKDPTPLGRDRALLRLVDNPLPMVVAAQSKPAVRRAAALGIGVLYDSLQGVNTSAKLSSAFDDAVNDNAHGDAADGAGAKIIIRRVWIGDPPTAEMADQMNHYRSYAPEQAMANWGSGDQMITGETPHEAATALAALMRLSNVDTVNVRVHVKGLAPEQVNEQLEAHREMVPMLRTMMAAHHLE